MRKRINFSIAVIMALFLFNAVNMVSHAKEIIFLTDDNNDDYNVEFLQNQGLNVTKFWGGSHISTWGADTIAMLNAADLIIVGRSIDSRESWDINDRATWNALTAPLIHNSPFPMRYTRANWFNSGRVISLVGPLNATAKLPADPVFADVVLDNNALSWFALNSYVIINTSPTSGEILVSIGDSIPLVARFAPNVAFYPGGPDSAVAERVYFGFGDYSANPNDTLAQKLTHFPLTKEAKTIYLAEVSRLLGITPPSIVYRAPDFTITFMASNEKDDTQQKFLRAQGFKVNSFWVPGVKPSGWSQDTIDMLNDAELIIVGRSVQSSYSQDIFDKTVWNSIKAPLIHNNMYACRNTRGNWFNSNTTTGTFGKNLVADIILTDDPVLEFAPDISGNQMDWFVQNSDFLLDFSGSNSGTVVLARGDTIPLLVRFEADKAFYPGGPDSAVAPRVYFGFGAEPAANYFPLTQNAQAVYFAEIMRLLGGEIYAPEFFGTIHSLNSLTVDKGTLVPAFASDVFSYKLDLGYEDDILNVTAIATETSAMVEGTGNIAINGYIVIYVTCTSKIGQFSNYRIEITKEPGQDISVTSPNGGESWKAGSSHNITWTSENVDNVRIDYSGNGGSTWSSVINNTPSDGSYLWIVPSLSSVNNLIRITDISNPSISDISNSFSIVPAGLPIKIAYIGNTDIPMAGDTIMPQVLNDMGFDVTYFALGENNPVTGYDVVVLSETPGSNHIGWAQYSTVPLPIVSFKVHALKTAALNWVAIPTGTIGVDYSFSMDSIIKVIDADHPIMTGITGDEVKVLDNSASGANVGWVNLTDLNGVNVVGQSGTTDASHQAIVAIEEGTVLNASVTTENRAVIVGFQQGMWAYLNDNGKTIIKNSINWAASGQNLPTDPEITVTSPGGGESWKAGSSHNITWTSVNVNNVRIEFSGNGGSTWSSVINNTPSDGSYLWTVPSLSSVNNLIRITDISNPSISDMGNSFSIVPTGLPIRIAYIGNTDIPMYGDTIMPQVLNDMGFDVTYFAMGENNPVTDYDVVVLSETPGSYHIGWAIYREAPLPLVVFKVHAMKDAALNWIITPPGTTGIDYDNSLDSVVKFIDKTHPILTGFTGDEVQVLDEAWRSGANVGWVNLGTARAGVNVVGQSGTSEASHQAIVAIEEGTVLNASVTTENRAVIVAFHNVCWTYLNTDGKALIKNSINWAASEQNLPADPEITVTSPGGGESWKAGSSHNITWTSVNVNNVRIEFSGNGGSTWSSVISNTPSDGSYSWSLPNISSINCLIRITSLENEAINDRSNSSFTIYQTQAITIISPNGGEELTLSKKYSLEWTSFSISNVDISYSVNNGTTWTSIEKNYPSTGIYSWNVVGPVSNLAKLKISSSADEAVFDLSDAVFFIKDSVIDGINHNAVNTLNLSCYPNPVSNYFQIKGFEGRAIVRVFNLNGELILIKEVIANEIIEVDMLSQGVYIVKIATANDTIEKKLVK